MDRLLKRVVVQDYVRVIYPISERLEGESEGLR